MTTLAQALATALHRYADHTFGLMGNGNAHLIDELARLGMPISEVRHEAATVASADAYARVSGKLAVATATYGAGFTNTLTALAEAAQARTPLLLVVGDAPASGKRPWDIDQEMSAAALGVRTYELSPANVDELVDRAATAAVKRRQPVVLAIPYDLVNAPLVQSSSIQTPSAHAAPPSRVRSSDFGSTAAAAIEAAAQVLAAAERPVVLAGHGAWLAGVGAELDTIAEQLGALTASTALARGIFKDQSRHLGITGGFGQHAAMQKIAEADVVLVVGASLNQFTMRFGELVGEGAHIIRVDLDEVSAPKTAHTVHHQLLRGDAAEILDSLISGLNTARTSPATWSTKTRGLEIGGKLRVLDRGTRHAQGLCTDGRLDPRPVAARLADLLPDDRHVTSDGGHFIGWANMYWPVASPERMIMVGTAYQTIGLGLATVAGVAAAAPDSTVVVTTGDGGGLMALADLETAIRTAKSCVIVVWNDGAYGAEVHLYGAMGLDERPMRIPDVDFAGLASALGATGVRVETLSDLDALSKWRADGGRGTILLDCRISRSVVAPYQREIQQVNGIDVSAL